ncbi:glucan endo-1,6-beta-glucosidase [Pleurotus eryngii]|uniref:Glucan endo-1,6-beta-glucosidase n=1 Tax=Pleurotus eryngii TaxID=5323 RepID=A0A9P6DKB5_PLEER|nr:glucan endo-1,6-beta-glucosidase [Pleurotus eryngii]
MRNILAPLACLAYMHGVAAQQYQIWDMWQTTWDRSKLFTYQKISPPINFTSPSGKGSADIVVNDGSTFQSVWGFGGSLTDSSALTLNNLKSRNPDNYWKLLNYLFVPTDAANAAGLSYIRIPIGASDFSASQYSLDDTNGDTSFNSFNIDRAPSYLFSVLKDIQSLNKITRIHIVPWSPPGWMKNTGTMSGGSLNSNVVNSYATYLRKAVQGFKNKGVSVYAISIQNEPLNSNPTYPTCTMTAAIEAQIGKALRSQLNNNGLSSTKLIGFEHNWSVASSYPVQLMQAGGDVFNGVAFHCYAGNVAQQETFHEAFPTKEIYFSECTGTFGSDWWSDIKWYLDNIFIGSVERSAHAALMWNIALDGKGNPKLPGTSSCGGPGCRAIVTVNSDGSYSVNQEFYAMAQASKAILPRDSGGPWGKRVGVSVGGSLGSGLRVSAFVTGRANPNDWERYSLVVLNWNDHSSSGSWNPVPVKTTIEFRGTQATITFPVGVSTLWWYAPKQSFNGTAGFDGSIFAGGDGTQQPLGNFNRAD